MPTFDVRDGQFRLNGQPHFVHAAEFHYFRTPADQWVQRLSLLQDAGFNTVAAYIPWLWHQPQPGVTDLDGHTHALRDLAGFLDLAAEMGFHIIARPGPYIMAETINEGIPPWVFDEFPQAAFIDQDGSRQNIASYLQPDFLHAVEGWYQAVFAVLAPRQISQGGRIVMIQLDNEMGMIQWVRNIVDTNPDTIAHFAGWLGETYGARLAEHYPAPGLEAFLRAQLTQPGPESGAQVLEDYRRFYRSYLRRYAARLWEMARSFGMEVPPVINIHGFTNSSGGRTFPIGLSQLVEAMELEGMVSATDVYPLHIDEGNFDQLLMINEMTRALQNPDQPLFSIEFQSGGNQDFSGVQSSFYDLHSRLCISTGMRAINHYSFFAGENDPILSPVKRHDWGPPVRKDGTVRRHYARYGELSRTLAAYGADLVRAVPRTVTTIGFSLDDFMTEVHNPLTRPSDGHITHQREVILFDFLARGLALTHRPFAACELARASLSPTETPTLWVMMERQCDAEIQQSLLDYARAGGRLILTGRMCAETRHHESCTILQDGLGVQVVRRDPPFTDALIEVFGSPDIPVSFLETYSGAFDEVFAISSGGEAAGFVQPVGQGTVMMLGAALAARTLDDLNILDQMAQRMDCPSLFSLSDWADVRLSEGADGNFLFVSNYLDDPIETTISQAGTLLLGGHRLILPARRGVILPLEWRPRPGITVHYLTAEVREVAEDEAGLTLRMAQADFFAALTLNGYRADDGLIVAQEGDRVTLRGTHGSIRLESV